MFAILLLSIDEEDSMTCHDTEFPSVSVQASSRKQAFFLFNKTYGYYPKDIKEQTKLRFSKFHVKYAYQHEKEMQ